MKGTMLTPCLSLSWILLLFFSGNFVVFSWGLNACLERLMISLPAFFWQGNVGMILASEEVRIVLRLGLLLNNFGESGERGGVQSSVAIGIVHDFFLPFSADKLRWFLGYWLDSAQVVKACESREKCHLTFNVSTKIRELLQFIIFVLAERHCVSQAL